MKYIIFIAAPLLISCTSSDMLGPSDRIMPCPGPGISGVVDVTSKPYEVLRAPDFDPETIFAEAGLEKARGDYTEAFGHYLAVCDEDHPAACLEAAQLADSGLAKIMPQSGIGELYRVACTGGETEACGRPGREE